MVHFYATLNALFIHTLPFLVILVFIILTLLLAQLEV